MQSQMEQEKGKQNRFAITLETESIFFSHSDFPVSVLWERTRYIF